MKKLILIEGGSDIGHPDDGPLSGLVEYLNANYRDISVLFSYPHRYVEIKKKLYDIVNSGEYSHIILLMHPSYFLDEIDLLYFNSRVKLVAYHADIPEYFDMYYCVISQYFNVILVDDILEKYRYKLFRYNAEYFQHGYNVDDYTRHSTNNKDIDVSFIGRMDREGRSKYIEKIESLGLNVFVAGYGTRIGYISNSKMINIYSRSKIVINLTGISIRVPYFIKNIEINSNIRQLKGRLYEAMLCGAMVLSEKCASSQYAENIIDYIDEFTSPEEMVEKINQYLKDKGKRVNMSNLANLHIKKNLSCETTSKIMIGLIDVRDEGSIKSYHTSTMYKRYMVRVCVNEAIKSRRFSVFFMQIKRMRYYLSVYIAYDIFAVIFINALRFFRKFFY